MPSLLAAIGEVIETHMVGIGFLPDPKAAAAIEAREVVALPVGEARARLKGCPRCGQPAMVVREKCDICLSCGYSKCG